MRRKRQAKNEASQKPSRKPDPAAAFGTLADRLGKKLVQAAPPPAPVAPKPQPAAPTPKPVERLTPEELMARAFDAAGKGPVYDGKYLGSGFQAGAVELIEEREDLSLLLDLPDGDVSQDDLLFAETMGRAVQRMTERDRYADMREHNWVGARWADETELATLTPEQLFQPDMTGDQRELLKRSRKHREEIPTLNIRLERLNAAMAEVEYFVREQGGQGARFVRIITGKGKQSSGEPVLKPAVIAWCIGGGALWVRRWAPETDRSGNFGCLVLELDATAFLKAR